MNLNNIATKEKRNYLKAIARERTVSKCVIMIEIKNYSKEFLIIIGNYFLFLPMKINTIPFLSSSF